MMKGIDMKKVKELRGELLFLLGNIALCIYFLLDGGFTAGITGLILAYYVFRPIKKALKSDTEYEKYLIEENDERKNMIVTKAFSIAGIASAYFSLFVIHIFLKHRDFLAFFLTISIICIYLITFAIAAKYYDKKY